jgi:hypothetical protein
MNVRRANGAVRMVEGYPVNAELGADGSWGRPYVVPRSRRAWNTEYQFELVNRTVRNVQPADQQRRPDTRKEV